MLNIPSIATNLDYASTAASANACIDQNANRNGAGGITLSRISRVSSPPSDEASLVVPRVILVQARTPEVP